LQDFDRVGRHPDVDLLESRLQSLLELKEKPTIFGLVRDVYEEPNQVVAVRLAFVTPEAADRLRLTRHRSEVLLQFQQSVGDEIIRHRLAVIAETRTRLVFTGARAVNCCQY